MSLQKSVEQINPGMDQTQVLEEVARIQKEEAEKQAAGAQFPEFDFGAIPGGDGA